MTTGQKCKKKLKVKLIISHKVFHSVSRASESRPRFKTYRISLDNFCSWLLQQAKLLMSQASSSRIMVQREKTSSRRWSDHCWQNQVQHHCRRHSPVYQRFLSNKLNAFLHISHMFNYPVPIYKSSFSFFYFSLYFYFYIFTFYVCSC